MALTLYQWRAFIGPAYEIEDSAYVYDWITPWNFGEVDLAAKVTTLSATVNSGDTTATLATVGNVDAKGGVWIGPNGSGQAWEYVSYSGKSGSQITGLRRESSTTREHNGIHTSGAAVRQWYELTADNGRLRLTEQLDQNLATITWQAEISGMFAPPAALRNGHLIAIQTREGATGSWSRLLMGFIQQPGISDNANRLRPWSMKIVSLAQQIAGYTAKAIRVGELDLAPAGSAQTDTPLASPLKEIYSGDYTAADPDFSGQSAIDEQAETLWIAERVRGSLPAIGYPAAPSSLQYGGFVCSARLWRWPGEAKGYRWLEVLTPAVGGRRTLNNGWLCNKNKLNNAWIQFNALSQEAGQLIILAENPTLFAEANPLAEPVATFEVGSAFFDSLDLAGDAIAIYIDNPGDPWSPTFAWGTGGTPRLEGEPDGHAWTSNTITAPTIGQIIRYGYWAPATLDKDHFVVDYIEMAGYRTGGDDPWILIDLPRLGLTLRDDITSSAPGSGSKLYLSKGEADSTEGLASTGTIQIGLEQITYSSRDADGVIVSARGANSTTATAHDTGDLIRVIDTDGVATEGQLISAISWSRNGHSPYPESFKVRRSNLDRPRTPPEDNHTDDYELLATVTDHAATSYSLSLGTPRRATGVIIEIDHNNVEPSRPRLNEVKVIASTSQYDSDYVLAATTADMVIWRILNNAGLSAFAATLTTSLAIDKLVTGAGESVWSVIADLAAKTATQIDATRAGKLAIAPNALPGGSLTPSTTITDVVASAIEFVQAGTKPYAQVIQPYRLNDGTTGEAKYPTNPVDAVGPKLELAESRYASSGAALSAAQRAYILARYPVQFVLQCAEQQPTIRPGAVVAVQWQLADDQQPMSRTGIVMAADHEINNGIWTTVLTVAQVDREAAG